jgi:predicted nucleotidyltransferase
MGKRMNKLTAVGIIAEYNPFHNGHKYHLDKAMEMSGADCAVVVMSGDFVQRGEPALFDKWERARIAVECGADLVLELPFAFACNNAGAFARGGVGVLAGLGCISHLAFGSETANIEMLEGMSRILVHEDAKLSSMIRDKLSKGLSYPRARYEAIRDFRPDLGDMLGQPNDILAVEYLKEIYRIESSIRPLAIRRHVAGYDDEDLHAGISSATAIRKAVQRGNIDGIRDCVPEATWNVLKASWGTEGRERRLFELLRYKLLSEVPDSFEDVYSISEGLNNKLVKEIIKSNDLRDFIDSVKSKRYTRTRIQRVIIHTLMNLSDIDYKTFEPGSCLYARVLGFSKNGTKLLRQIKKNELASIPLLTNINKEMIGEEARERLLMYDIRSADVYNLISKNDLYKYSDKVRKPFFAE